MSELTPQTSSQNNMEEVDRNLGTGTTNGSKILKNGKSNDGEDNVSDKVVLKRQLSLFFCVMIIVGTTIGSGIFISPKGVLRNSKSVGLSLVVWTLSGILSILGGLTYAELGTTFGKSGGDYAYIHEAFGPLLAFLVVWIKFIISGPVGGAILSITFATYLMKPFFLECEVPKMAVMMIAVASTMSILFINSWKVKAAAQVNNLFTVAKTTGLVVIIVAGIVQLFLGKTQYLENSFEGETPSIPDISLAFYSALFAYGGWTNMNSMTEEITNPARNFPIAVVVAEMLITVLYVTANIAYLTAMSPEELLASEAVAQTFAEKLFSSFAWVVPVTVAISIYGAALGSTMSGARIVFSSARDRQLPDVLSMIHINYRTPMPSILARGSASLLVLIISSFAGDGIYELTNFTIFSSWLIPLGSTAALMYLRWKRPDISRPFKVPLIIPIIFFVWVLYLEVTGLVGAPLEACIGLGIILTGVPAYYFGKWKNKPRWFLKLSDAVGKFVQRYLLVVRQEEKTY
ncbi:cystine/glutamate transporter-like [Glandiceps talaboti]